MSQQPDGLVIGLGRAGTTFLYDCFRADPNVFVPEAKDLFFFDREYDRGMDWYRRFFELANERQFKVDVSHDYLFCPQAASRLRAHLGRVRLVVVVRNPVDWVRSIVTREIAFGMHGRRASVHSALAASPGTIASGAFLPFIRHWKQEFGDYLKVLVFDDLLEDQVAFYASIARFYDYEPGLTALPDNRNRSQPGRHPHLNAIARGLGAEVRRRGGARLVEQVRSSPTVERLIYRSNSEPPDQTLPEDFVLALRDVYRPTVDYLSGVTSRDLVSEWGYV